MRTQTTPASERANHARAYGAWLKFQLLKLASTQYLGAKEEGDAKQLHSAPQVEGRIDGQCNHNALLSNV